MRRVTVLLCLLLGCLAVSAANTRRAIRPSHGIEQGPITRYTDLMTWGRAKGLSGKASADGEELRLSNKSITIVFRARTQRILFDGIEIRLTESVRKAGNAFQVATRDVETLLNPLMVPPKRPASRPIRTIAINAGHGGKDPGHVEGRREEKTYALLVAVDLKRRLERAGLRAFLVRGTDAFVDLDERPAKAARAKADLYVSIHFNGIDGPGATQVSGVETYCLTPAGASSSNDAGRNGGGWHAGNRFDRDNIVLAHEIHRAIVNGTDLGDRGVRRARFRELTLLDMPGILVEGGYMTHAQDRITIYSPEGRAALSRSIVDGILAFKRLVERGR